MPEMSTVNSALMYVGRVGTMTVLDNRDNRRGDRAVAPGIGIHVRILDAKPAYGRMLLLIQPLAGEGACWTDVRKVRIHDEQDPPPPGPPPVDAAGTGPIDLPLPAAGRGAA